MFTFLPKSYRPEIEREYRKRVFAVAFALLALLLFAAAALAAPSYVIMLAKRDAALLGAKSTSPADASANASLETRIKDIKAKEAVLKVLVDQKALVSVLEKIVARRVSGISLSGVGIKRSTDRGAITVSGTASTRDALVAFSKSLAGEPSFSNISLPVSVLAKSQDIGFSISIDSHI